MDCQTYSMDDNGLEDVIDEMMDAYWREQADRLDPDAGALLQGCRPF